MLCSALLSVHTFAALILLFESAVRSYALVVCWNAQLVFWHIPKSAGSPIQEILRRYNCSVYSGLLTQGNWAGVKVVLGGFDVTHVSLFELVFLEASRRLRPLVLDDYPDRSNEILTWPSFLVARNPYTRIISAYGEYLEDETAGSKVDLGLPTGHEGFVNFMRYLRKLYFELGELMWPWRAGDQVAYCLRHFRPASFYSHWPNGSFAVQNILRYENFNEDLHAVLSHYFPQCSSYRCLSIKSRLLQKLSGRSRSKMLIDTSGGNFCRSFFGCNTIDDTEITDMLSHSIHTPETIGIVNRIYQKDFALLGYSIINIM